MTDASILKPNATALEQALEKAMLVHKPDLTSISAVMDPQRCPAVLLPWLAWAVSVDTWDANWDEAAKRAAIAASLGVHRRKGTLGALKAALASAGFGDGEVIERFGWRRFGDGHTFGEEGLTFQNPDHWAEFRLAFPRALSPHDRGQLEQIVASVAPARCHLRALAENPPYPEGALMALDADALDPGLVPSWGGGAVVQGNADKQPTCVANVWNGRNAVRFSGGQTLIGGAVNLAGIIYYMIVRTGDDPLEMVSVLRNQGRRDYFVACYQFEGQWRPVIYSEDGYWLARRAPTFTLAPRTTYKIAVKFVDGQQSIWIDGVEVATGASPVSDVFSDTRFDVGSWDGTSEFLSGDIIEVGVYGPDADFEAILQYVMGERDG